MRRPKELLRESSENAPAGEGSSRAITQLRAKTHLTEDRKASIKLEDGSLIKGKINLLAEPAHENRDRYVKHSDDVGTFYRRISDIFTRGANPFIVVSEVMIEGQEARVLIINKNKILWVSPED